MQTHPLSLHLHSKQEQLHLPFFRSYHWWGEPFNILFDCEPIVVSPFNFLPLHQSLAITPLAQLLANSNSLLCLNQSLVLRHLINSSGRLATALFSLLFNQSALNSDVEESGVSGHNHYSLYSLNQTFLSQNSNSFCWREVAVVDARVKVTVRTQNVKSRQLKFSGKHVQNSRHTRYSYCNALSRSHDQPIMSQGNKEWGKVWKGMHLFSSTRFHNLSHQWHGPASQLIHITHELYQSFRCFLSLLLFT